MFLTLKNINFENVTLTKVVDIHVIKGIMHNVHDIK